MSATDSPTISNQAVSSRARWLLYGCFAFVLATGAYLWLNTLQEPSLDKTQVIYEVEKSISYSFTVKNDSFSVLNAPELSVYAPVARLSSQRCCDVFETSHSYELVTDSLGNQAFKFSFDVLPPYSQQLVKVKASLDLASKPNSLPLDNLSSYLNSELYIEVEHPKIGELATKLKAPDQMQTAAAIYQWVFESIKKRDYTRDVKGALYAINHGEGDCTENAYLFVALARAAGIPARPMGGYVLPASGLVRATDYHNWAEFYVDGVWRIADPHQGVFDKKYENYVATRVIANVNEGDFTAHRYWHSGEGLSVRMN